MTSPLHRALAPLAVLPLLAGVVSCQDEPAPKPPAAEQPAPPQVLRARHILIPYAGAPGATSAELSSQLTEAEAKAKAEEVLAKLKNGGDFTALAREHSSCPSKNSGGYLGHFRAGNMVPEFEQAVRGVKDGELVGPVKTDFGWHVILRMPAITPWPEMVDASHILIGFEGGRVPGVTRSKAEAEKLANDLYAQLKEGKATFEELATKHSDDKQSAQDGGALGTSPPDRYVPEFADALAALKVGEMTPPVATLFGFHVIRRNADPPPPVGARHILIPWQGAMRADATVTRSKEEAKKLADEVLAKIRAGKELGELAPEYSSCPSKNRGGDLGTFGPGQMIPEFEKAVRAAKVDEVVGPVETAFGWHLIQRTK